MDLKINSSPHSQAQLQFAQANAQTKNCNRACLSANAFLPTLKTNFFGNGSSLIERITHFRKIDN